MLLRCMSKYVLNIRTICVQYVVFHLAGLSQGCATAMSDSQPRGLRHLIDIIDPIWKKDTLPFEDIAVPHAELPDPEPDSNSHSTETLAEQERKWPDLALPLLSQHLTGAPSS